MTTEQGEAQKQADQALPVRKIFTDLDTQGLTDTYQTCLTFPTSSTQNSPDGNVEGAERQRTGAAASSLNYTETAPTVSAGKQDEGKSRAELDERVDMSSFEMDKEADQEGNEKAELAASLEIMRRARTGKAGAVTPNQETRKETMYTHQDEGLLQGEKQPPLLDPYQKTYTEMNALGERLRYESTRGRSSHESDDEALILPKHGTSCSTDPNPETRGRLQSRTYVRRNDEPRENSNGSRIRSRSPIETKKREGRKRMIRTKGQVEKVLACQQDHNDVNANWQVGGNFFGYYCTCKMCGCKMNDLIYWGPVDQVTREKRLHGAPLDPSDNPENYPQDKVCCVCNQEGCNPMNCIEWQTFNRNGLDGQTATKKPPVPRERSASKARSSKSNAAESISGSSNSNRTGTKRPKPTETKRGKSPRTNSSSSNIDILMLLYIVGFQ